MTYTTDPTEPDMILATVDDDGGGGGGWSFMLLESFSFPPFLCCHYDMEIFLGDRMAGRWSNGKFQN